MQLKIKNKIMYFVKSYKMKNSHLLLLLFCITLSACSNINYSKDEHLRTSKLNDSLFVETYRIYSGGVTGGDVKTTYLTDSTSFRKYVGKKMDYQEIIASKMGKYRILVYKYNIENNKVLNAKIYDIDELKKEGKFE